MLTSQLIILGQIKEVLPVIEHASQASDRWLFIATLVILMLGGAMVIRWLVKSLEAKDVMMASERKELHGQMERERIEWRAARKEDQAEFLKVLTEKTEVMRTHTEALDRLHATITTANTRAANHK